MKKYIQNKDVDWLETPKGTVYIPIPENVFKRYINAKNAHIPFIVPEDEFLRKKPLGIRLDKHRDLFDVVG